MPVELMPTSDQSTPLFIILVVPSMIRMTLQQECHYFRNPITFSVQLRGLAPKMISTALKVVSLSQLSQARLNIHV